MTQTVHTPWCTYHDAGECHRTIEAIVLSRGYKRTNFPAGVSIRRNLEFEDEAKIELETPADTSGLEDVVWLTADEARVIGRALIEAADVLAPIDRDSAPASTMEELEAAQALATSLFASAKARLRELV